MKYHTSPFWVDAAADRTFGVNALFTSDGVLYNIPYRDPVSTGFYYGEGREALPPRNELVFSTQPETFAVANILPTVAGVPRINPNAWQHTFSRSQHTMKI